MVLTKCNTIPTVGPECSVRQESTHLTVQKLSWQPALEAHGT